LRRLAFEQAGEPDQARHPLEALGALGGGYLAHLEAEDNILAHAQVRKQRVGLEHHRDGALRGRQLADVLAADQDAAGARLFEAGDQAQRGRFAAAGGAEQHQQAAFIGRQRNLVDRRGRPPRFAHAIEQNAAHRNQNQPLYRRLCPAAYAIFAHRGMFGQRT
jgi:hypothetical protein